VIAQIAEIGKPEAATADLREERGSGKVKTSPLIAQMTLIGHRKKQKLTTDRR
jgi:hypothetical protein